MADTPVVPVGIALVLLAEVARYRRRSRTWVPRDMAGEKNPSARLTANRVANIRATWANRERVPVKRFQLARRYGISLGHLGKILRGERWR